MGYKRDGRPLSIGKIYRCGKFFYEILLSKFKKRERDREFLFTPKTPYDLVVERRVSPRGIDFSNVVLHS